MLRPACPLGWFDLTKLYVTWDRGSGLGGDEPEGSELEVVRWHITVAQKTIPMFCYFGKTDLA